MALIDKLCRNSSSEQGLEIRGGPEYDAPDFLKGAFQLVSVPKIEKKSNEREVNQMLLRGWHILTLEKYGVVRTGYPSTKEESTETTSIVLGNPDEGAFQAL